MKLAHQFEAVAGPSEHPLPRHEDGAVVALRVDPPGIAQVGGAAQQDEGHGHLARHEYAAEHPDAAPAGRASRASVYDLGKVRAEDVDDRDQAHQQPGLTSQ